MTKKATLKKLRALANELNCVIHHDNLVWIATGERCVNAHVDPVTETVQVDGLYGNGPFAYADGLFRNSRGYAVKLSNVPALG